ncbi:hypothetical protein L228DRAFT_215185 [Xylona heveae TC161]|uniref:Amine oxidase n=1 Tax=Xylona heveae (strain CBS 132557 / TC161) TaxID=1328760 RepID=A0A164ZJB2_XYLHT|nr:hypothetical protein L228DRAFT_215185 [Xylona heveae TC161]KZF19168.1 hypothetical protein L228DRAFT_215185 [Xylona heveae TC161]
MALAVPPNSLNRGAPKAANVASGHPLDPLAAVETIQAAQLLKGHATGSSLHFKYITIAEPPKNVLRAYLAAERTGKADLPHIPRRASALYYLRGTAELYLAKVNLDDETVDSVEKLPEFFHAQADIDELIVMKDACLQHPRVRAEIERFRLPKGTTVVCDLWPYGRDTGGTSRRMIQYYMYARDPATNHEASNHYDLPLQFSPIFDYVSRELVDIIYLPTGSDQRVNPEPKYIPHTAKEYHHDLQPTPPRSDLKPLLVHQPQGASFNIDGHLITWQKWRLRLGFNWREGMVLHDVTYDGRELFHRLSLSELFVPYGDPRTPYNRKSVFDFGDIGAGVVANNLKLGCDCLGLIKYFSFIITDSNGNPVEKPNAVCMHEIDNGIGWKHTNTKTGPVSIVRSRVLVLQSIITLGNYEYVLAWHLDQAAGLHYQIQATGIVSTAPIDPGVQVPWGTNVNEGVMAPYHQHVFCLRIDPCIDGDNNTFLEEDSIAMPLTEHLNPKGVGYTTTQNVLSTSSSSEAAPNRVHKIINPSKLNRVSGRPVGYAIYSPVKQMLLAHPTSWHSRRAKYARHPFWVTAYRDDEIYPAGDYTYQSLPPEDIAAVTGRGGAGHQDLAAWTARKDPTENTDIVIWHSICLTHNPRPEDYPVMPCDTMTVSLKPSGFFEQNPALDVPQSTQAVNQSCLYGDFDRRLRLASSSSGSPSLNPPDPAKSSSPSHSVNPAVHSTAQDSQPCCSS